VTTESSCPFTGRSTGHETKVENDLKGSSSTTCPTCTRRRSTSARPPVGNTRSDTVANLSDTASRPSSGRDSGARLVLDELHAGQGLVEAQGAERATCGGGVACALPATTPSSITFIDGDFRLPCNGRLGHAGRHGSSPNIMHLSTDSSSSWAKASSTGSPRGPGEDRIRQRREPPSSPSRGRTASTAATTTAGGGRIQLSFSTRAVEGVQGNTVFCTADIRRNPGFRFPARRVTFRRDDRTARGVTESVGWASSGGRRDRTPSLSFGGRCQCARLGAHRKQRSAMYQTYAQMTLARVRRPSAIALAVLIDRDPPPPRPGPQRSLRPWTIPRSTRRALD
jgi:hypothetical protein